jgi:hypothetical protein
MDSKANLDSPQTPFLAGATDPANRLDRWTGAIAGRPEYFSFQESGTFVTREQRTTESRWI